VSIDPNSFILEFQEMQDDMAATNRKNGFVDQDELVDRLQNFIFANGRDEFLPIIDMFRDARVGLKLMLAVGELGETLEAVRKTVWADSHVPAFTAEEVEVADAIIRLMNYAYDRKLRLAEAIVAKNEYNRNRADHSKEQRESKHGKRF